AIARFLDGGIGQADDDDNRITPARIDLHLHRIGLNPIDGRRTYPGQHQKVMAEAEQNRNGFPAKSAGTVLTGARAAPMLLWRRHLGEKILRQTAVYVEFNLLKPRFQNHEERTPDAAPFRIALSFPD